MPGLADRIVALMKELRPLASRVASDRCERDYIVHMMVLRALSDDPTLTHQELPVQHAELRPN